MVQKYGNNVMTTRNYEMARRNNENTSRKYDIKSLNNVMTGRNNEKTVNSKFVVVVCFFQMKSTVQLYKIDRPIFMIFYSIILILVGR